MKNNLSILTVSELTRQIKGVLEKGFTNVAIQGEISNFKRHSSGHIYFTLKDETSQIQAVIWRSRQGSLFFTPQDGMKVVARGNVTVYEVRGVYQLDVALLQPVGIGELQLLFERLKEKLSALGYFDPGRKKPIPRYPRRIGIVTSATGAAIKDIINILTRRCPSLEVILNPVSVQGAGAAEEIAAAIQDFNLYGEVDVLIVGRGGGSLEDLWAFNEEVVARAIFKSTIPIISAVGHEIDFTIADFVADLRAPTPSAAAELVASTDAEMVEIVQKFCYTAQRIIDERITSQRERIVALVHSYSFNRPLDFIRQQSQRLDELRRTVARTALHHVNIYRERLSAIGKRIGSANPSAILERGYALVLKNGSIIRRAGQLHPLDAVELKFFDGHVPAKID